MSCCFTYATTVKSFKLGFKKEQFSFEYSSSGSLQIVPLDGKFAFGEDTSKPGLPYFSVAVSVPGNKEYRDCSINFDKKLLYDNCILMPNPASIPTSSVVLDTPQQVVSYTNPVYPIKNVEFTGESEVGNSKILYFLVCPFVYDNINGTLYFASGIQLNIALSDNVVDRKISSANIGIGLEEKSKELVINPTDIPLQFDTIASAEYMYNKLDYVIITSNVLKKSFVPLQYWKRQKGVWTEILTVEEIAQNYDGGSIQEKIKNCLYELRKKRLLKYVLLGGDDTIVPVKYCRNFLEGTKYIEYNMPTDLYYSCFGGVFDWDGNKNGIYGELEDNIDLSPSVYLSRLPFRTDDEVAGYVKRVISYEKMPDVSLYSNKILMSGSELGQMYDAHSDAELKSELFYNSYIKPFWNGERTRLFDTRSDCSSGYVSNETLKEQLAKGYAFADIITHGTYTYFSFRTGSYNVQDAATQSNSGYTLVTTMACNTNAFDKSGSDPCLSEALIRNADSGIIGYLGSSRYGWYYNGDYSDKILGKSLQYEAEFYKNLFSGKNVDLNFGKMVAYSKYSLIGLSNGNNAYRWLQYSLNAIGDPEMPIFTTAPMKIPNPKVKVDGTKLQVSTELDSCTICLMSKSDNGQSYYKVLHNVKTATFENIADSMSLCITKQNYIPKLISDVKTYDRLTNSVCVGGITGAGKIWNSDDIAIKYHVADNAKDARIVVTASDGSKSKSYPVLADIDNITVSGNDFGKGIISISLFVNSKFMNSINYNNQ